MTIPDKISLFRMTMAPVLLLLAWFHEGQIFIIVLALAYVSDAIDGPIARRLGQQSAIGPRLDTWADASIYLSVPLAAWWLWPEMFMREMLYFMCIIASIIFPLLAGVIKFRQTTGYHTWLAETAAVCTTISSLLLFTGIMAWPFRISALLCLVSGLEEILITLSLTEPASDVRSLWHVIRKKSNRIAGQENTTINNG